MNRYKIAIVRLKDQPEKRKAYRFPGTRYVSRTVGYIRYCINNKVIFLADNIPQDALDSAVIKISESYDIPVIVDSDSTARLFSISHSHKIYSLNNLPKDRYVICYNCPDTKLPSKFISIVVIYGHTGDLLFL